VIATTDLSHVPQSQRAGDGGARNLRISQGAILQEAIAA